MNSLPQRYLVSVSQTEKICRFSRSFKPSVDFFGTLILKCIPTCSIHYCETCWQSTVCSPSTIKIFSEGFLSWIKQAQPGRDLRRDLFLSNFLLTKDRIISDSYGSPIWLVWRISIHYSQNVSSKNAKQIFKHRGEHITGI